MEELKYRNRSDDGVCYAKNLSLEAPDVEADPWILVGVKGISAAATIAPS